MNCSSARLVLYPKPELSETRIDMSKASHHLARCEACQDYFRDQEAFASDLALASKPIVASDALQQRVSLEIQGHRRAPASQIRRSFRRVGAVAASVAVLIAGFAAWSLRRAPSREFFEELCADHAKYLDAQSQIRTDHPEIVERWFRDKAGFRVHVPSSSDAQLLGARLCFLKTHRAALVFFRKEGHPVSLFELNASEISLRALQHSVIDANEVWHESMNGYSVVAMRKQGVVSILVSDLRESDLMGLASL